MKKWGHEIFGGFGSFGGASRLVSRSTETGPQPKFWNFICRSLRVCYWQLKLNAVPAEFATEIAALKEKLLTMASFAEAAVKPRGQGPHPPR